ncbi:cytochrome C [Methyloprofundus sp.]|uniref:cytochrome C n=1 Tax=Methyloprofundus sp. TaxID=2020875 RepID=UPI003D0ABE6E
MNYIKSCGRHKWLSSLSCLFMLFMFSSSHAVINAFDKPVNHPPIPLLDEQGNHVLESNNPYSPKKSCEGSGCHDYDAITHAYHFEMGRDESSDDYGAKRGMPHLVSPGYYGGYTCMGGDTQRVLAKKVNTDPENFADLGSAGWVKACMSCHTGGGWAEKDREGIRYDEKKIADIKPLDGDYYEREIDSVTGEETFVLWDWKKSGVGEADCLFCHVDFNTLKTPEDSGLEKMLTPRRARQAFTTAGFFRQAASGLIENVVDKDGKNIMTIARSMQGGEHSQHGGGEPTLGHTLDENGMPVFNWNPEAFDGNGRTTIPMIRFPANENCMECHRTSNSRRGFYGFGEAASATLEGAGESSADGTLVDDYQDDVHKGKTYTDDNGQTRDIENCNSCHSKQYFKSPLLNVDLDANHDFPKGNSDMDVRNDLDYAPNAKSCEDCHIKAKTPIIPSGHDTLLAAHIELWKGNGDMAGYSKDSLTQVTQTHFDIVSCQACHINGKISRGKPLQILFRYRIAENGMSTMVPYNPRVRSYWKDKTSGRVIVSSELSSVFEKGTDADGNLFGSITDPISGESLGKVSASEGRHGLRYGKPETYESFMALKSAYDSLLRKKGFTDPDTAEVLTESNEYIISHNTRPSPDAVQCEECHERKQSGAFSALVSPFGIMGKANEKTIRTIPDARLVAEGHYILDLAYMKVADNGDVTQNVEDILFETKVDPFMTILKNSSATEVISEFKKVNTEEFLATSSSDLSALMAADLVSPNSFVFQANKGNQNLRNMTAVIDGNTVNNILFPTYRGALGVVIGAESAAQGISDARGYGQLRSAVYSFDVRDSAKKQVTTYNGAAMFVKVPYKGSKTDLNSINVVMANWSLNSVTTVAMPDLVMMEPADEGVDGYVIFKTAEPGFFIVTDK